MLTDERDNQETQFVNNQEKNIRNKTIFVKFSSSEKNKNQKSVNKILNIMLKNNFNRNDCLIAAIEYNKDYYSDGDMESSIIRCIKLSYYSIGYFFLKH